VARLSTLPTAAIATAAAAATSHCVSQPSVAINGWQVQTIEVRKNGIVNPVIGKSGPKDQVALHYYYTSPSHWCTTHEVSKL